MHCWSRYLLWLVIALLGSGHLLSACGQMGPLYLPEPAPAQTENAVPEVAAEAAENDPEQAPR